MKKSVMILGSLLVMGVAVQTQADDKADQWKANYFKKNPAADTNGDGTLSWPELKAHRKAAKGEKPAPKKAAPAKDKKSAGDAWKDKYFAKNPDADTNKDGILSWPEYKAHKGK